MFEIVHSLLRQFGPEQWTLYRGKHLLSFVDNHDVSRIASILTNEKHIPLTYGMIFGMPGIPCVYYGSEWGAKAHKNEGDPALRVCFDEPLDNELSEFISKLATAHKNSKALCYGDFRSVVYKTSTAYLKENMMMNVFLSLSMQTKILSQYILTPVAVLLLT